MEDQIWVVLRLIAIYFAGTILVYLIMTFFSRSWVKQWIKKYEEAEIKPSTRQVTFIVPACNEERVIIQSVLALLNFPEDQARVVVVNDGSRDQTMQKLLQHFQLEPINAKPRKRLSPVFPNQVFKSNMTSRLLVVDKPNSGKSDSINCALQYVDTEYFAVSDADTVWDKHALEAFLYEVDQESQSGHRVVAMGGLVQLMNPNQTWLTKIQAVEYMRAFLVGRCTWNAWNLVHLISGAAGVFHTETTLMLGGIPVDSQTEDLDLTFRMHKHCQDHGIPYKIRMIPRFVCRTWAPDKFKPLMNQRLRWQRGLVHTLWNHRSGFLSRKGILYFTLSMGYLFVIETMAPFLALTAIALWAYLYSHGSISGRFLLATYIISMLVGWTGSFLALFVVPVDHVLGRTYKFHKFVWYSFLEMLVVYPTFLVVRFYAALTAFRSKHSNWKGAA